MTSKVKNKNKTLRALRCNSQQNGFYTTKHLTIKALVSAYIEKIDAVCREYTDHAFVHASILGVASIMSLLAFGAGLLVG
ncbi:MAG: hypothetical protein A3E05_01875 [Candidatus Jacksonbacteria bacterium RIFCSPHIGHO2_12_FULL_44_12]|nr:MAG: hypothetical protein A3E05_01875 [Candidatus Jacksonbacteria bacterium RIFCSPHIGHO2_12_FULL_44_12]